MQKERENKRKKTYLIQAHDDTTAVVRTGELGQSLAQLKNTKSRAGERQCIVKSARTQRDRACSCCRKEHVRQQR